MSNQTIFHIFQGGPTVDGIQTSLAQYLRSSLAFTHIVVALRPGSRLVQGIRDLGVEVIELNILSPYQWIQLLRRILTLRKASEVVIHSWGHAANTFSIVPKILLKCPVLWSFHDSGPVSTAVRIVVQLNRYLSPFVPTRVVFCAPMVEGIYHQQYGYAKRPNRTIPYGIDCQRFAPNEEVSRQMRHSLGIDQDALVIGMACRYSLEKNPFFFIEASALFKKTAPPAHFIFCGPEMEESNEQLMAGIRESGLEDCFSLLGDLSNVEEVFAILDVICCCSYSLEALPVSVAEGMACGAIPVTSRIGDLPYLVGEAGFIVDLSIEKFAEVWEVIFHWEADERAKRSFLAAERIREYFPAARMATSYEEMYSEMLEEV